VVPLLDLCREKGTALRIGVNHGSLSPSIMDRFGDTPQGMVAAAPWSFCACVPATISIKWW